MRLRYIIDRQHTPSPRHQLEAGHVFFEEWTWESFRQDICRVFVRWDPCQQERASFDVLANKMIPHIDMFRADVVPSLC